MCVRRKAGTCLCLASLVLATIPGRARGADTRLIPDVPRFAFFVSSHSTAAAEVLAYRGVKRGLPEVVLIGGLEGRIYRCDCGKDINLWDVAEGTRLWASAEGLKVRTEAKVLRAVPRGSIPAVGSPEPGQPESPKTTSASAGSTAEQVSSGSAVSSQPGAAVPHSDAPLDFDYYRQSIDAGRPVILTYSLDEASAKGMEASFESQQRVSVVGIGYFEGEPDRSPDTAEGGCATCPKAAAPDTGGGPSTLLRTNGCATHGESAPDGYVIVSLPEDADKEKRFAQLAALPGVKPGEREGLLLIPWDVQTGNLIATFVEVGD